MFHEVIQKIKGFFLFLDTVYKNFAIHNPFYCLAFNLTLYNKMHETSLVFSATINCRAMLVYVQAAVYCTAGKATKIVIALTAISLIPASILLIADYLTSLRDLFFLYVNIFAVVYLVLPSSVLVVNLLVVCEIRRSIVRFKLITLPT